MSLPIGPVSPIPGLLPQGPISTVRQGDTDLLAVPAAARFKFDGDSYLAVKDDSVLPLLQQLLGEAGTGNIRVIDTVSDMLDPNQPTSTQVSARGLAEGWETTDMLVIDLRQGRGFQLLLVDPHLPPFSVLRAVGFRDLYPGLIE